VREGYVGEIAFVEELPRNTMGKVLKDEVKKFF
jgi:acyl-coenzyme A synthetase/AMP-(fatty) acid ligase